MDEQRRSNERSSDDPAAEAAYLRTLLHSGELSEGRLALLAYAGLPGAELLCEERGPGGLADWLCGLLRWGEDALLAACVALAPAVCDHQARGLSLLKACLCKRVRCCGTVDELRGLFSSELDAASWFPASHSWRSILEAPHELASWLLCFGGWSPPLGLESAVEVDRKPFVWRVLVLLILHEGTSRKRVRRAVEAFADLVEDASEARELASQALIAWVSRRS